MTWPQIGDSHVIRRSFGRTANTENDMKMLSYILIYIYIYIIQGRTARQGISVSYTL